LPSAAFLNQREHDPVSSFRQPIEPVYRGGDPLVGRGQRDADVPGARGTVELARGDEDAEFG
jgi:hypothetical protein